MGWTVTVYEHKNCPYIVNNIVAEEEEELLDLVKAKVMPGIMQYVRRVIHPKDGIDASLTEDNLELWATRDIEHAIAEWMYNHGFKK